jgi:DNA (cytosine-5)-methyltransferase 1
LKVYYNDNDAKAAAWLRELIKQGLLPDGDVDERSILEVDEVDLWGYGQWHFFAGIGGWPLALQLAGLEGLEGIFTGSPPCQPFSSAGQQKGKSDERHLAPKFIELVRAVRPRVLFGEQVASAAVFGKAAGSARSRAGKEPAWAWLDDLSDRLEAAHYAVGTSDIPAAGVGAPHIRQRTFFGAVDGLADYEGSEREWIRKESDGEPNVGFERMPIEGCSDSGRLAYAERSRPKIGLPETQGRHERDAEISRDDGHRRTGPGSGRSGFGGMADTRWSSSSDGPWGDVDWLFCRDGKWRPVESGTFPLADGIPARVGRLRGYGNAIVPPLAAEFVRAFLEAAEEEA